MRVKEAFLRTGALFAGAAIATHGYSELVSDTSTAFDKREEALNTIQSAVKTFSPQASLPQNWDEIPDELKPQLMHEDRKYRDAQNDLNVLSGAVMEPSIRQLKTLFNGGEVVLGIGMMVAIGYKADKAIAIGRQRRRDRKFNERLRMQKA